MVLNRRCRQINSGEKIPKSLSDLGWFGLLANTADPANRISRQENGRFRFPGGVT